MNGYNPFSLKDKTILITGASSGIGKAIAMECSKMGARLIITGRDEKRLEETYRLLSGEGHRYICLDLKDSTSVNDKLGSMDSVNGIVHSAGLADYKPFQFANRAVFDYTFDINFFAPANITQQLLKRKKIASSASIVFVSSINGIFCSSTGATVYSASKGAINGLIKGLAIELATKKIRVNSVNPGMVNTPLLQKNYSVSEEQYAEDMKKYPLRRYAEPEEVAYAVIYLLSDAASYITGSQLVIDGGYTLL